MNRTPASSAAHLRRRVIVIGLLSLSMAVAVLAAPLVMARPDAPEGKDRRIALLVSALMDRKHLAQMRVNDEISQRAIDLFFQSIDPLKLYFYQSDVDQFAGERDRIDDYVRNGDVKLAKRIFDVFLTRVGERITTAHRYVDSEHDFTLDESIVREPDAMSYATTPEEADERWRKRVKYDLLLQIADDTPDTEAREKLHKRYRSIRNRWEQTDNDELLELFLSAVTMSFDPHSSYMSPNNFDNFLIQMRLELDGIGASLESKYGETIVRRIVPGGAAFRDGRLKVDDVIIGVGQGSDGEVEDIVDMKLNDVVMKIRGKPGSVVRLEVKAADGSGIKTYDITRDRIELKDSEARSAILERGPNGEVMGDEAVKLAGDAKGAPGRSTTGQILEANQANGDVFRIGVIDLPSFYMDMEGRRKGVEEYKSTSRDVRRLLEEFNAENVDLVVVDLRSNGGGSLPESVQTTGLFIDQGPVVQVKGPDGRVKPYPDEEPGAVWSGPLMVLINKFSASASEIFAGAIQDYGRGIVVGDHATHGKGTVQQLYELGNMISMVRPPNYGALKLTIQQFYRPGGDSTQNRGVVSDIELPSQTTHWKVGESDLDYAMKFDRVLPLPHESFHYAGGQMIEELRNRSQARISESDYFINERKRIERYKQREQDPTVTLNKEKFLAERAELNTEKAQEKIFEDMQMNDRPVFASTPYNDEVVAIALDYLELLGDSRLASR
ncbi:MAG: carboxy terminal-processing peptidase [Planctomycetota bacterium]